MTREQWAKLTSEEQRIKVAELCGWKDCQTAQETADEPRGISPDHDYKRIWHRVIPDYLNDLNAMHEAETHMLSTTDERVFIAYVSKLKTVMGKGHMAMEEKLVRATASQRAEAFVLTMDEQ